MRGESSPRFGDDLFAPVGEVDLCYQTIGDRGDRPMLLVMGLGAQLIRWPDGLCALLAERGFFLVRFDNRDCGRSTILDGLTSPSLAAVIAGDGDAPYTLSAMAADAAGLLDRLEIDAAHVVGASLGGMIAQTLAIERPERVLSLASLMSTTGARGVGEATEAAREVLMTAPPVDDRDDFVAVEMANRAVIGSPGLERDEAWTREIAGRTFDRGVWPSGTRRQLVAIFASGDRSRRLGEISVPTVVVHGADDPLIDVSGGRATAAAIPGAELVVVDGMGHDLPPAVWDLIVDTVAANADRAEAPPVR